MSAPHSPAVQSPALGEEGIPAALMNGATPTPSDTGSLTLARTVAIVKPHAMQARLDIENRISEAGFEIVKERQFEIDTENDPETLFELFGEDYNCFAEGPVWVYILERKGAVQVWQALMGDPDPELARVSAPNSIRAVYGVSPAQNAIMGSPDAETAEIQIASLFASSPPFPTTDLPEDDLRTGSLRSVSSSVLSAVRAGRPSGAFKARAIPASNNAPSIVPRTTRAAALRAGTASELDSRPSGPRAPIARERLAETFADVPGHGFRSEKVKVASTAPPKVAPRMSRAASLRLGTIPATQVQPMAKHARSSTMGRAAGLIAKSVSEGEVAVKKSTFEGVPGHKRRETITVTSTQAPTVAPRLNKAAALRQAKDNAPPPSAFRTGSSQKAPSLSRSTSRQSLSGAPRPPSQQSAAATRPPVSRTSTTASAASSVSRPRSAASGTINGNGNGVAPAERPKPKPRPSSLQPPSMTPRPNKAAMLRAAQMELAAAAKKKGVNGKPKPLASRTVSAV